MKVSQVQPAHAAAKRQPELPDWVPWAWFVLHLPESLFTVLGAVIDGFRHPETGSASDTISTPPLPEEPYFTKDFTPGTLLFIMVLGNVLWPLRLLAGGMGAIHGTADGVLHPSRYLDQPTTDAETPAEEPPPAA